MRVLFTGLGSIGQRHLRLLRERNHEVIAFRSERDSDSVDGVTEFYDLDETLAADPDVSFVTNPTNYHVETAMKCARAGCDLFVEKPLAHTMDGVKELIETVEQRGLVTMIGCNLRFHPVLRRVQSLLADDTIGDVYTFDSYSGSYLPDWRETDYRESYSASPDMGGGVVLDLIHELDYVHWLFGPVEPVRSWVDFVSHLQIDTEDVAEIVLSANHGVVGRVHLDYVRPTPRRTLEVTGREGVVKADLLKGTVTVATQKDERTMSVEFERDDMYRQQLDHFLSHVERGVSPDNDVSEGAEVLSVALEAKSNGQR